MAGRFAHWCGGARRVAGALRWGTVLSFVRFLVFSHLIVSYRGEAARAVRRSSGASHTTHLRHQDRKSVV